MKTKVITPGTKEWKDFLMKVSKADIIQFYANTLECLNMGNLQEFQEIIEGTLYDFQNGIADINECSNTFFCLAIIT